MHDPMTVAFTIVRPWPSRSRRHDAKPGQPRWRIRYHHDCRDHCGPRRAEHEASNPFPWWRVSSYMRFWTLAGRGWYWPDLLTIWHAEPDGHDSGEVCPHDSGWRWHAHHWRIQLHPLQHLRRRLLTRCEWCRGRSRKDDPTNISNSGDRARGPWWRGERGLLHLDCSAVERAHRMCLCAAPVCDQADSQGKPYGFCARCNHPRQIQASDALLDRQRMLAAIPPGHRDPDVYRQVCDMFAAERAAARD